MKQEFNTYCKRFRNGTVLLLMANTTGLSTFIQTHNGFITRNDLKLNAKMDTFIRAYMEDYGAEFFSEGIDVCFPMFIKSEVDDIKLQFKYFNQQKLSPQLIRELRNGLISELQETFEEIWEYIYVELDDEEYL